MKTLLGLCWFLLEILVDCALLMSKCHLKIMREIVKWVRPELALYCGEGTKGGIIGCDSSARWSFLSPFLFRSLIYLLMMSSVVEEVIKMQSVQHLLEPVLEPLIRSVVCVFFHDQLYCRMFYITYSWLSFDVVISIFLFCSCNFHSVCRAAY